jgi:hypothetical protein
VKISEVGSAVDGRPTGLSQKFVRKMSVAGDANAG